MKFRVFKTRLTCWLSRPSVSCILISSFDEKASATSISLQSLFIIRGKMASSKLLMILAAS